MSGTSSTIDPRLLALLAAPFERERYLTRVARVVRRYGLLLGAPAPASPDLTLLREHPSALLERGAVSAAVLAGRATLARRELAELEGGAPLPAPPDRSDRAIVLATADVEHWMGELRLIRRVLRRIPAEELAARYPTRGRPDPLFELTPDLVRGAGAIPRGRMFRVVAELAGARHGVHGLGAYLVPRPPEPVPEAGARARVCSREALAGGTGVLARVFGRDVAVFEVGGQCFAIDDGCPHRGGPLHQGDLIPDDGSGWAVSCPLHGWSFELATGRMRGSPRVKVGTYEVELDGEDVYVRAPGRAG